MNWISVLLLSLSILSSTVEIRSQNSSAADKDNKTEASIITTTTLKPDTPVSKPPATNSSDTSKSEAPASGRSMSSNDTSSNDTSTREPGPVGRSMSTIRDDGMDDDKEDRKSRKGHHKGRSRHRGHGRSREYNSSREHGRKRKRKGHRGNNKTDRTKKRHHGYDHRRSRYSSHHFDPCKMKDYKEISRYLEVFVNLPKCLEKLFSQLKRSL